MLHDESVEHMSATAAKAPDEIATPGVPRSKRGDPAWEIALLFPEQGNWSEAEYLALDTNHLVELSDGCLEFLPMPTRLHQLMTAFLHECLKKHVAAHAKGDVLFAALPVRLWPGKYREPDVMYFRPGRLSRRGDYPDGADLVMEVVSPGHESRERDLETKRAEYAQAGIPEYWIVDPEQKRITVLSLDGKTYRIHGEFTPGQQATSVLLPGFAVDVTAVFAQGEQE